MRAMLLPEYAIFFAASLGIELIFCLYDIVRAAFATADEHGQIHV